MSNIYINEPATTGKVVLNTTVGEIDIELWCRETPKACRNFIQLCLEKYYDNTIFHRVVKNFIVQGGDPSGTGLGGESIYGEPFKDEFHSRLRFERRGLVALANAGKDDNGSQFFFTMAATPELQKKHTIFGKVTGTTIFNMLKLQEGFVDQNEKPDILQKIISTEVLKNPFDDLVPRKIKKVEKKVETKFESKSKATKNFNLLSFGEEAEIEEEDIETGIKNQNLDKKSKSLHNLVSSRIFISTPDVQHSTFKKFKKTKETKTNIKNDDNKTFENEDNYKEKEIKEQLNLNLNDDENTNEEDEHYSEQINKMKQAKKELELLKKEALKKKLSETNVKNVKTVSDSLLELQKVNDKYRNNYKKPLNRAQQTFDAMENFRKRLKNIQQRTASDSKNDKSWMTNKLKLETSEEENLVIAKDANLKNDNWYDLYDPRNAINKQRRELQSKPPKKNI